jgi:hypothetical protein
MRVLARVAVLHCLEKGRATRRKVPQAVKDEYEGSQ